MYDFAIIVKNYKCFSDSILFSELKLKIERFVYIDVLLLSN